MNDQLILKFPTHQAYKKEDFYVSPSNQEAYDFINSWPKWIKRIINIYGPPGSGKSHLASILKNIKDEKKLEKIVKELKLKITDLWKSENIINLAAPLSIRVKFEYEHIEELSRLKNIFQKMNIIEKYSLEEFNTNESYFKIYYYGNPKKLKSDLLKFGYKLNDNQGFWQLYLNE